MYNLRAIGNRISVTLTLLSAAVDFQRGEVV
jgi:hypothetical protein